MYRVVVPVLAVRSVETISIMMILLMNVEIVMKVVRVVERIWSVRVVRGKVEMLKGIVSVLRGFMLTKRTLITLLVEGYVGRGVCDVMEKGNVLRGVVKLDIFLIGLGLRRGMGA